MSDKNDKNILYGGPEPPLIDDESKSLGEVLLRKLTVNPNDVMFIDGLSGMKYTRTEIRCNVIRLAKSLSTVYGIKEGDVIGLYCENRLEFPIIVFAAFCLGCTVAPLNVTYTDRELDHAVNLSRPKLIFASSAVAPRALKIAGKNKFVQKLIILETNGGKDMSKQLTTKLTASYSTLLGSTKLDECNELNCKPIDMQNNVALVLCSSGTTGLPKGVELTQKNILVAMSQINVTVEQAMTLLGRLSILLVIPCFHAYGLLIMVSMSLCGAETVFLPKFEEHLFLNTIQTYKTNTAFLVPPLLVFLAKSPLVDKYDLSSLFVIGCGAAPLGKDISDAVKERLNIIALRQGYGMSEMTLSVLAQTEEFDKVGSVGTLRAGTWGKVIDPETGKALGPNQRGEMCFKGSSIMRGYIGNNEATRQTIDADGWLHTGDIGYYDDDHEWFIVDRLKELIKYKGFQVPPAEIEAQLLTHPDINDAAVIGIPDENAGELPLAFVVRKPNSKLTEKDVIDFVAKTASPAKRLHGGVRFIDAIPKNPTGKILRRILRDYVTKKQKSKL